MPYKSDAQRRKFHQLLKEGKISADVVAEYDKASAGKKLPARAKKKSPKPQKVRSVEELKAIRRRKYGE